MMRKRPMLSRPSDQDDDVNVTPLLDIVFIMLIFFIVTATFVKEPGVDISRPEAQTAEDQELVSILVAITADNEIWINQEQVPLENVRVAVERLRRENPKGRAVIQTDAGAHTRYMLEVLHAIRDAGVSEVVTVSAKRG